MELLPPGAWVTLVLALAPVTAEPGLADVLVALGIGASCCPTTAGEGSNLIGAASALYSRSGTTLGAALEATGSLLPKLMDEFPPGFARTLDDGLERCKSLLIFVLILIQHY